jgi:hypothetical protein
MNPSPALEFAFEVRATLAPPLEIGRTPHGERRIIPITGGTFEGPEIKGRVLPMGADWQLIRPDGVAEVDARYTLETSDGALVAVSNRGIRHGPPEVIARLRAGEPVDPSLYYFRSVPSFETSAPELQWLTRSIFVASGERHAAHVVIRFWRLM